MDTDTHELEKLDPEAYKERIEAREKKRAEERLTLKHKNTSKWVKHMLGRAYGDDHDEDTREAIQEQINLGERLRQKQLRGTGSDEEEESEEETVADIENEAPLVKAGEKMKGVMGMAFMQRSMDKQREEANKLLSDLKVCQNSRASQPRHTRERPTADTHTHIIRRSKTARACRTPVTSTRSMVPWARYQARGSRRESERRGPGVVAAMARALRAVVTARRKQRRALRGQRWGV